MAAAAAPLGCRVAEDACLLVSELVTNSVRHGAGACVRVRIEAEDLGALRCEVADDGSGFECAAADDAALGGWGLCLVEVLADRWGVAEGSARVWFELSANAERRSARDLSTASAG